MGLFFYIIYLHGKQVEKWTVIYECLQPNKEKLIGKKIFFLTSTVFETLILLQGYEKCTKLCFCHLRFARAGIWKLQIGDWNNKRSKNKLWCKY